MKKRFLSAALALAMVLTLLPLSVMPASAAAVGDGTETVTYIQKEDGKNYTEGPGWYVAHVTPASGGTPAVTTYHLVTSGYSVGGSYYTTSNAEGTATLNADGTITNNTMYTYSKNSAGTGVVRTGLKGAVTVIGGTASIDAVNNSTLTIDVFGGSVSVTQTNTNGSTTKLTDLKFTNNYYTQAGLTLTTTGTVSTIPTTVNTLSLTNVQAGSLNFAPATNTGKDATTGRGVAHSVILTNATIGNVTLNGVGGGSGTYTNASGTSVAYNDTANTHATQTVTVNGGKIGNIIVSGNNSTVTLNAVDRTSNPTVSLTGTNTTLNVQGGTKTGLVTIQGATAATVTSVPATPTSVAARPANVTVNTGCEVGNITQTVLGELCNQPNSITINGKSGNITMKNATVSVAGGEAGDIKVDTGTVNVSGTRAKVGGVELEKNATFNLTGNHCDVGALTIKAGGNKATVTFNVPNDYTNNLTSVDSNYAQHTIKGGTWANAVDAKALDLSLVYQLEDTTFTYYTSDQLGEAVLKQGGGSSTLTMVGVSGSQTVTFMNGTTEWGVLTVAAKTTIPKLPTQMNTVATPKWSDGKNSDLSGKYNTPEDGDSVELNAGGGGAVTGDVTKLTSVKVSGTDADIRASLVGNVITLTGAVGSTDRDFTLTLETDAVQKKTDADSGDVTEEPVTIEVGVTYTASNKSLSFNNPYTDGYALSHGVVIENTFDALKLANGTRYTLNGSGLVVRSYDIEVKGIDTITNSTNAYSQCDIEVVVSAPGYTTSDPLKNQIISLLIGSTPSATSATFDYSASPAIKQAINAALATITDDQVKSWINMAQRRAWSDHRTDAYTTDSETAYDSGTVVLVPYLQVNVTNYQPSTTSTTNKGSITATLTPMWRVEVRPAASSTKYMVKDAANVAKDGAYIVKAGAALTNIASDLTKSDGTGGVEIKFAGVNGATFAHQDNTYDYKITGTTFKVTHGGTNGLGTFVLDAIDPLIAVYTGKPASGTGAGTGTPTYYSSLQAAVDAAKNDEYILVDSKYGGSTTINMTGTARTIYVQANGKNVVVANASGGLVDNNATGSLYTIKLNRDNTVTVAANIIVGEAENGLAVPSTVRAKAGDKVTITATPKEGYVVKEVTATTNTGIKVPVTNNGNNTYTFNMPANATRVDVTPVFALAGLLPFNDVPLTANFYNAVEYCYNHNLIQGTTLTTFSPYNSITRGQIVLILYRQAGSPTVSVNYSLFTDMPTHDAEMCRAVTWAFNNKIIEGYPDRTFKYNVAVSRQELATILYNYQTGYKKLAATGSVSSLNGYSDGSATPSWSNTPMRWALGNGIITATGTSLNPYSSAYRYQTAEAMYMYMSGVLGIK